MDIQDPYPSAPYVDISDIYSPGLTQFMITFMNASTVIIAIIIPFYIYVVVKKSPKIMKSFKYLLLAYIFATIFFEFAMISLKPLMLLPLLSTYPVGLFSPMDRKLALVFLSIMGFSITAMLDFLLAMLAERYFTVFQINTKKWVSKLFYSMLGFTNLACTSLAIAFIIADIPSEAASLKFLSTHILNSQKFLESQPSLIVSNHENRGYSFGFFLSAGIFGCIRMLSFGFFLYQNVKLPMKSGFALSPNTRRQHRMLINVIFAQLFGIFLFLSLPLLILVTFIQFPSFLPNPSKVWICLLTFLSNFIFYDFFVTIYCVTPYRNFILQLFCKRKHAAIINVWSSSVRKSFYQQ